MTDIPTGDPRLLQRVLAQTPVGRQELREPQSGLSLPQRWLLGQLDGQADLATLAARPGGRTADRLPRDAARLVQLGLAVDIGAVGPTVERFGPASVHGALTLELPLDGADAGTAPPPAVPTAATPARARSRAAAVAAGAALLVLGSAAAYVVAGGSSRSSMAAALPAAPASAPSIGAQVAAVVPAPVAATPAGLAPAAPVVELTAAPGPAAVQPVTPVTPVTPGTRASPATAPPPATGAAAPRAAAAAPVADAAPAPPPATTPATTPPAVSALAPAPVAAPTPVVAPPAVASAPAGDVAPPAGAPALPPPGVSLPAPATAAPAVAALRPVSTVEPSFPRDGLGLGGRTVNLQARLTVDATGAVTAVAFVPSSASTRAFERSARAALLQWRFPAGAGDRVYTQQLRFSEE